MSGTLEKLVTLEKLRDLLTGMRMGSQSGDPLIHLMQSVHVARCGKDLIDDYQDWKVMRRDYVTFFRCEDRPYCRKCVETIIGGAPDQEGRSDRFPHVCPTCRGPAYLGLNVLECERGCR